MESPRKHCGHGTRGIIFFRDAFEDKMSVGLRRCLIHLVFVFPTLDQLSTCSCCERRMKFWSMLRILQMFKMSSACKNFGPTATDVAQQRVRTAPFIFESRHPFANIVRSKPSGIFTAINLSNDRHVAGCAVRRTRMGSNWNFNDCPQTSFSSARRASAECSKDEQCGKLEIVHWDHTCICHDTERSTRYERNSPGPPI